MIIDNFYVIGVSLSPEETHAKAVVYPYAVLAAPISFESFQAVARQGEIVESPGVMNLNQLPSCGLLDLLKSWNGASIEHCLGVRISERPYHSG